MKKIIFVIATLLLLITSATVNASEEIKVVINNKELYTEDKPVIVDGRTMLPLRAIGEAMGCEVIWVSGTQTANLKNESTIVSMQIGNKNISRVKRTNMEQKLLQTDVAPMLINDRTYIPVRAFAEALDAVVGWDNNTKTVMIVYDTTLKYAGKYEVETYAGTGERKKHDSGLSTMAFVDPESITVNADGDIIVADSGMIRTLANGKSETIEFEPVYITANMVRCHKNEIYVLTNEFQNSDGVKYYGIVKLTDAGAEGVFITEATYSSIADFDISKDGKLYVIYNNAGVGKTYLGQLDLSASDINYITELDSGIKALAVEDNGNIFLGNTVKGSLYFYNISTGKLKLLAGADEKTKFVDGPNAMFFEPRRLEYSNGYLYVLDYNVVRRVAVDSAYQAVNAETLAGKVTADQHPETINGKGSDVTFAPSYLMDMVVVEDDVYLTDPKNAVIRYIHN
ncbi:MAG: hypothetical protein IJD97_07155 [Clostridia bacterium]|nr:hypothetical protein [Clostridia bacterium]